MPPLYVLDTNILVHLIRQDAIEIRIKSTYDPLMVEPRPAICVVTQGELRSLAYQFQWGARRSDAVQFLLQYFRIISLDDPDIVEAYAVMDAYSERTANSMGKNDIWIAAAAKVADATILTTDRDFDHLQPDYVKRVWVASDSDFTIT